jgi:small GTP-binding protein
MESPQIDGEIEKGNLLRLRLTREGPPVKDLTPSPSTQFHKMGILERIADIEHEMARTQKNKATEYHFGLMKARLAKLKAELLDPKGSSSSSRGEGFDVAKSGDARAVMIGFPSVGKSTLMSKVTTTKSAVAAYEFTTLTCVPGRINYRGSRIQLLDLPGIIEGAAQGKGRGRQVIAVAKTADVILMMLDATKGAQQKDLLEAELEAVGIRLNRRAPDISVQVKAAGGICISSTVPLTRLGPDHAKVVGQILHELRIFHAQILFRQDASVDDLIDVLFADSRRYIDCIYVYNKIDSISLEQVDELARLPHTVVLSCELDLNIDWLIEVMWARLGLRRVYTKKPGENPDFSDAIVLRKKDGFRIGDVCKKIHQTLVRDFKFAFVWGTSAKHSPQRVGLSHELEDEDVIQIIKKRL